MKANKIYLDRLRHWRPRYVVKYPRNRIEPSEVVMVSSKDEQSSIEIIGPGLTVNQYTSWLQEMGKAARNKAITISNQRAS